jgi:hypothetical protein
MHKALEMGPKEIVFPLAYVVLLSVFSMVINYVMPSSQQSRGIMMIALASLVLAVITAVVTKQTHEPSVPSMSVAEPADAHLEAPVPSQRRIGWLGVFPIPPPNPSLTK